MGGVLLRLERTAMTSVNTVVEVGEHFPQLRVYKSRGSLRDAISHCFCKKKGRWSLLVFFLFSLKNSSIAYFYVLEMQEEYRLVFSISRTIIIQ